MTDKTKKVFRTTTHTGYSEKLINREVDGVKPPPQEYELRFTKPDDEVEMMREPVTT